MVPLSIPQVKNHGIAHLPLDDPCLYPPHNQHTNYFNCIVTGLYVTLTWVWELTHMFATAGKPISSYVQTSDQYFHCISYISLFNIWLGGGSNNCGTFNILHWACAELNQIHLFYRNPIGFPYMEYLSETSGNHMGWHDFIYFLFTIGWKTYG